MPYCIKHHPVFVEVEVWGETSTEEVLTAVYQIHEQYPRKEQADLWSLSRETMLPLSVFPTIVKAIGGLCGDGHVYRRSAIVASDRFQKAMADMYRSEATALPFEIGVFTSRDDAVRWLSEHSPSGKG
jgi:hypothetical protein